MTTLDTIGVEDQSSPAFFKKIPISIERGEGVYVWDEEGKKYLDFTSGWGVTCLGHAHPVITEALLRQSRKIIQNPSSGLTYSPVRARLLSLMGRILPSPLTRVFFSNSGAEANDAAIKLARKVTGRPDVISTHMSFHGRTISTASATGQSAHRDKFNPLMPNYRFVPYNDVPAVEMELDDRVAAVIVEPIQGEGGVRIPGGDYLWNLSRLCKANGSLLIVDEIQTGFCRTGPMFAVDSTGVEADFLTMAKGIAGGFPIGAFAASEQVASKFEFGDHGGTFCGNPLGCAAAHAVIAHLLENDVSAHVAEMGDFALAEMSGWNGLFPGIVREVRGRGLLLAIDFCDEKTAMRVTDWCLAKGLFVRQTQGNLIRIFPALNIKREEMADGLETIKMGIGAVLEKTSHNQSW